MRGYRRGSHSTCRSPATAVRWSCSKCPSQPPLYPLPLLGAPNIPEFEALPACTVFLHCIFTEVLSLHATATAKLSMVREGIPFRDTSESAFQHGTMTLKMNAEHKQKQQRGMLLGCLRKSMPQSSEINTISSCYGCTCSVAVSNYTVQAQARNPQAL